MINLTGNRIAVLRDATEETTQSGIYMLEKSRKPKQTGTVKLVGENIDKNLIGTRVVFDPNCAPQKMPHEDQELLLMFKTDIWAILKN